MERPRRWRDIGVLVIVKAGGLDAVREAPALVDSRSSNATQPLTNIQVRRNWRRCRFATLGPRVDWPVVERVQPRHGVLEGHAADGGTCLSAASITERAG